MGTLASGKVLVTGATGMTGRHLWKLLTERTDIEVIGTCLNTDDGRMQFCDLSSVAETEKLLTAVRPSAIYHCAGTFANRWETDFACNVASTRNLLDGILKHSIPCRVLAIGSAAEYGNQPCPPSGIDENAQLLPVTVYGLTKALQTHLVSYYHRAHRVDVVLARTFNLYGEGCSPALFPGRILEQIQAVKAGRQTNIVVGGMEARRDYLHVSEAASAYLRIMERGVAGEVYNVGSGVPIQISEMLDRLLATSGMGREIVRFDRSIGSASAAVGEMFADITKLRSLN